MLFIDLETTGLDPRHEAPLEVGIMLVKGDGRIIDDWSSLVWEDNADFTKPVSNVRHNKLEPVYSMHDKSGLWEALDDGDEILPTREDVSVRIIKFLKAYGVSEKSLPIAGLSIGSLDRPFLQHHFPMLNNFLSHRNIDISSIREICKRINPDLQDNIEQQMKNLWNDGVMHRALDDCAYAVELYVEYIDSFFYSSDD